MTTTYNHDTSSWDGIIYDATNPYTTSDSITTTNSLKSDDFIRRLTETYLEERCYGITLDEVLELIRKHQPERLL